MVFCPLHLLYTFSNHEAALILLSHRKMTLISEDLTRIISLFTDCTFTYLSTEENLFLYIALIILTSQDGAIKVGKCMLSCLVWVMRFISMCSPRGLTLLREKAQSCFLRQTFKWVLVLAQIFRRQKQNMFTTPRCGHPWIPANNFPYPLADLSCVSEIFSNRTVRKRPSATTSKGSKKQLQLTNFWKIPSHRRENMKTWSSVYGTQQ